VLGCYCGIQAWVCKCGFSFGKLWYV